MNAAPYQVVMCKHFLMLQPFNYIATSKIASPSIDISQEPWSINKCVNKSPDARRRADVTSHKPVHTASFSPHAGGVSSQHSVPQQFPGYKRLHLFASADISRMKLTCVLLLVLGACALASVEQQGESEYFNLYSRQMFLCNKMFSVYTFVRRCFWVAWTWPASVVRLRMTTFDWPWNIFILFKHLRIFVVSYTDLVICLDFFSLSAENKVF